jgi:hypothetical protein
MSMLTFFLQCRDYSVPPRWGDDWVMFFYSLFEGSILEGGELKIGSDEATGISLPSPRDEILLQMKVMILYLLL